MATSCKETKYATLRTHYDFQPIAVETLGPINKSATSFLYDLGRRISLENFGLEESLASRP